LGLHIRLVNGYRDSGVLFLAIDQNEVEGRTVDLSAVRSAHRQWLAPGNTMRVLLQFARATRLAAYPDVPIAQELAPDAQSRALIELAELPYHLSRPFAAPPGLPPARAKALQEAFLAVHKDKDYLADATKLGVDVSPIGGAEALQAIDRMSATPPALRDRLKRLMAGHH
jgi:tripartite-type tricarboxylate transporter receptor subunit TctC